MQQRHAGKLLQSKFSRRLQPQLQAGALRRQIRQQQFECLTSFVRVSRGAVFINPCDCSKVWLSAENVLDKLLGTISCRASTEAAMSVVQRHDLVENIATHAQLLGLTESSTGSTCHLASSCFCAIHRSPFPPAQPHWLEIGIPTSAAYDLPFWIHLLL